MRMGGTRAGAGSAVVCCLSIMMTMMSSSLAAVAATSVTPSTNYFGPSFAHPIELHHSLHPPLDKANVYWSFGGATVMTSRLIRMTPSTQDRRAWLWNEYPLESQWFEVEVTFEVYSKFNFGGDGFGVWFLSSASSPSSSSASSSAFSPSVDFLLGPVFGLKSQFVGAGVLFDIYDNDGRRNNPSVFAIANAKEGVTLPLNHDNDFENDMIRATPPPLTGPANTNIIPVPSTSNNQLNYRCVAEFRNTGKNSKALIRWLHNVLHVYIDTNDGVGYKFCLAVSIPDLSLKDYHLAFTAATGQLADNIDVLQVTTRYLSAEEAEVDDRRGVSLSNGESGSSRGGSVFGGSLYWMVVNVCAAASLGFGVWTLQTLKRLQQDRLDPMFICQRINPVLPQHYGVHAVLTVLLLLGGYWFAFLINGVLLAFRAYQYSKQCMELSSTMLAAKGVWGEKLVLALPVKTILLITVVVYSVMEPYYLYRWIW